ncbi:hypothetical protein [Nocardioides alkalitolerans]|uniref:hypothetical protein n=1 Tax=Nocardioides alkalitolerans TaxID=281714 RepID=UPI0003FAACBE|nr:hypothetical protein [Nocardioides alkalitolerans]
MWPTLRGIFWDEHQLHLDATLGGKDTWDEIGGLRDALWSAPSVQVKALYDEVAAQEAAAAREAKAQGRTEPSLKQKGFARARRHFSHLIAMKP